MEIFSKKSHKTGKFSENAGPYKYEYSDYGNGLDANVCILSSSGIGFVFRKNVIYLI